MAGRGGQPGNQNAAKGRRWSAAIEKALEERTGGYQEALVKLANSLLDKCEEGDLQALKELGDRLDGKPGQSVVLSGDEDNPLVTRVERVIVDAATKDA